MDEKVIPCFIKALVRIAEIGPEFSPYEADGEVPVALLTREIELMGLVSIAEKIRLVKNGKLLLWAFCTGGCLTEDREENRLFLEWTRENGSVAFSVHHDPLGRYAPAAREIVSILREEGLIVTIP